MNNTKPSLRLKYGGEAQEPVEILPSGGNDQVGDTWHCLLPMDALASQRCDYCGGPELPCPLCALCRWGQGEEPWWQFVTREVAPVQAGSRGKGETTNQLARIFWMAGTSKAIKTAMIPMTTSSSMRVNPPWRQRLDRRIMHLLRRTRHHRVRA
jgi:hypothetical protein